MKVCIPRRLAVREVNYSSSSYLNPFYDMKQPYDTYECTWGVIVDGEEVECDAYFASEKGDFDNLVSHSKYVGTGYSPSSPILEAMMGPDPYSGGSPVAIRSGSTVARYQNGIGFSNGQTKYFYFVTDDGIFWTLEIKCYTSTVAFRRRELRYSYPLFTFNVYYCPKPASLRQVGVDYYTFTISLRGADQDWHYYSKQDWLKPMAATMDALYADLRIKGGHGEAELSKEYSQVLDRFWVYLQALFLVKEQGSLTHQTWKYFRNVTSYRLPSTETAKGAFLLDEPYVFVEKLDPMLLGKDTDFSGYWRNWLTQHAFLDACENLPRLNDNSLANIAELCQFIYNLVVRHQIEIPKSLSDAWLTYRYVYSTGKLDTKEAIEFVHRHMDLGSLDKGITSYGIASTTYNDVEVTCRCEVQVKPRELGYLDKIWRALYTYGLQPNFYVVWDLIPYSFIVDWLIPVGDMLSVLDAERMYLGGVYYEFDRICYSLEYENVVDNQRFHCYTRWPGSVPAEFNELYWLDSPSTSSKTVGYRILDTLSLFIGR